jgi:hypothetical protein
MTEDSVGVSKMDVLNDAKSRAHLRRNDGLALMQWQKRYVVLIRWSPAGQANLDNAGRRARNLADIDTVEPPLQLLVQGLFVILVPASCMSRPSDFRGYHLW